MKVGVLGTGMVGARLATKLVELGNEVRMGGRDSTNENAHAWAGGVGEHASYGTFADAAAFGELLLNCTAGVYSLDALRSAGADNLDGKVLVDVANPLDFSEGMPPTLSVCNTDSLGEQIQREFPDVRVMKALNTVGNEVMVDPRVSPGTHHLPTCGDDANAKAQVVELLESMGWPRESIVDLGGIGAARGTEMCLALWIRPMGTLGTHRFNIALVRPD